MFTSQELKEIIQYLPQEEFKQTVFISKKFVKSHEQCETQQKHFSKTYFSKEIIVDSEFDIPEEVKTVKISFGCNWYKNSFISIAKALTRKTITKIILRMHISSLLLFDKLLKFVTPQMEIVLIVHSLDEPTVEKYSKNKQIILCGINNILNESLKTNEVIVLPERITTPSGITRTYLSFEATAFDFYSSVVWKKYYPMNLKLKSISDNDKIIKMKQFQLDSVILTGKMKTIDLKAKNIFVMTSYVPVDQCEELEIENPLGFPDYHGKNGLKKLVVSYAHRLNLVDLSECKDIKMIHFIKCSKLKSVIAKNVDEMKGIECSIEYIKCDEIKDLKLYGIPNVQVKGTIGNIENDQKCVVNDQSVVASLLEKNQIDVIQLRKSSYLYYIPLYLIVMLIFLNVLHYLLSL